MLEIKILLELIYILYAFYVTDSYISDVNKSNWRYRTTEYHNLFQLINKSVSNRNIKLFEANAVWRYTSENDQQRRLMISRKITRQLDILNNVHNISFYFGETHNKNDNVYLCYIIKINTK